jgi:hypothetical protein
VAGPELSTFAVLAPERVIISATGPPPHDLVLGFTPGDPLAAWGARVEPVLPQLPSVGFAGPFVRTIPGTDTYTDEL